MEWSIQHLARLAGTTSRTLRHYDGIGLLPPSRIGANGYRYYDEASLVRLQRILLLRDLGLGLPAIAEVLDAQRDELAALGTHLVALRQEKARIDRQIAAIEHTIAAREGKETLMAENALDGFDHTQYRDEVVERWGEDAYARSDSWWRGMSDAERRQWQERVSRLNADWTRAAEAGEDPRSPAAQELAARHVDWLRGVPGTPAADPGGDLTGYVRGLAEMYLADERFAANYGGPAGAAFVRDALRAYTEGA